MGFTPHVRTAIIGLPVDAANYLVEVLQRWITPVLIREEREASFPLLLGHQPQAILMYAGGDPAATLKLVAELRRDLTASSLLLISDREDIQLTRAAARAGVRSFSVLGVDDAELSHLFAKMSEERFVVDPAGEIIVLLGAAGGVGTTTMVRNLAAAMAQNGQIHAAVVDSSPLLGEVDASGVPTPPYSIADLLRDVHQVDDQWISTSIPRHPWGFNVLAQPPRPEPRDALEPNHFARGLLPLARQFTHVLVDAGSRLDDTLLACASVATRLVLVCTQERRCVSGGLQRLAMLEERGVDLERVVLLVNRVSGTVTAGMQEALGAPVMGWIPDDPKALQLCEATGRLLIEAAPRSRVHQDLVDLAARLGAPRRPSPQKKRRFGLF